MPLPSWIPDLGPLDLLLSVEELGSVGKAAAAHGISQPAASGTLRRLERRLGLALLARSPTGSTLTPAGQAVATWARGVVSAAASLGDNVAALRESGAARLRVAASLTTAEHLLPVWLLSLRRQARDIDVSLAVMNSRDVCDQVRAGTADVGFVESPMAPSDLSRMQVGTDELVLVASPTYPATRGRHALQPADLPNRPLLLREVGSGTRATFVEAVSRALGTPGPTDFPHAVELGSTAAILATARAGGGIGVVSMRAAQADLDSGVLARVPVAEFFAHRPLHAVWTGNEPTSAAALLIRIARG